jgi:excisionase family DNA binding protein
MNGNIRIPKICIECNNAFIAQKTFTKFCSKKCTSIAYKRKKRNEKVESDPNQVIKEVMNVDMALIQTKEYLSIKETCLLLGISRMSLYRYIKNKTIIPSSIGGKVIIKKQVITNLIK